MLSLPVIKFLNDILDSTSLNVPITSMEEVSALVAQTRVELATEEDLATKEGALCPVATE